MAWPSQHKNYSEGKAFVSKKYAHACTSAPSFASPQHETDYEIVGSEFGQTTSFRNSCFKSIVLDFVYVFKC